MYMFPHFPCSKGIQKLRTTQEGLEILIAPWWPSQPWFPHLLRLCVDHPRFFPYRRDLLSQQGYVSCGRLCHLHVWRLSYQHFQAAGFSKDVSRLAAAPRRPSTNKMYDNRWLCFAHWATGQRFDPLGPKAAQIPTFLYDLFDTHVLSPQTIKGYRSCLASVLSHKSKTATVQGEAKTISGMIMSMELQRPR